MIKALEDAVARVRKLREDRQTLAAEILEQIADAGSSMFVVPKSHRAAVLEGLGQADRCEFVGDDEMALLWKKSGL